MKIRQKLIIAFIGIALLIGAVGYVSVNISHNALQRSIGENSAIVAEKTIAAIDRIIYRRIERWQSYIATSPDLKKALESSNKEFQTLDNVKTYIDEKDITWRTQAKETTTPFMKGLIDNELSAKLRTVTDFYQEKYDYDIFAEVFITNKYGANIAQTHKTTDYYQADEEWWQKAKKQNLYIEDISYDESADTYSINLCIGIKDEFENFLGVMKVVLNITDIIQVIKELKRAQEYQTAEFKLLTHDGRIIYSTEAFELLNKMPEHVLRGFEYFKQGKHKYYFIGEGDIEGEGEVLFAHFDSRGYKDYKGIGWILLAEHETYEIFEPITALRNILLIISFSLTIIALLVGLFIARSISTPVEELKKATVQIGKGNLDADIDVKSKGEIGELAVSFTKMAHDLKRSQEQISSWNKTLEQKIEERTEELKTVNEELESSNEELRQSNEELETTSEELRLANEDAQKAKKEAEQRLSELEKFSKVSIGRELKMKELKAKVKELETKLKQKGKS